MKLLSSTSASSSTLLSVVAVVVSTSFSGFGGGGGGGGVTALQGNYLSQLTAANGGLSTSAGAGGGSSFSTSSSSSSSSSFFPAPSTTVGSGVGMADLYSSGPPGTRSSTSNGATPAPPAAAFGLSSSSTSVTPALQSLLDAWSAQVSVELSASQLYLSASIWCRRHGYAGMAAFMLHESDEERGHGLSILEWALQKHGWANHIQLEPLAAPKDDWTSIQDVWESILDAERTNTQNLLRLASLANNVDDYGSQAFLNPFHVEQIDAENKVGTILNRVRFASPELLMEIDHQLGLEAAEEAEEHGHGHGH